MAHVKALGTMALIVCLAILVAYNPEEALVTLFSIGAVACTLGVYRCLLIAFE